MIIGLDLSKILVERSSPVRGKIQIGNTLDIRSVETVTLGALGASQQALSVGFSFGVTYGPNIGTLSLQGNVLYLATQDVAKAALEEWAKRKELPKEISLAVINAILMKCNVRALQLAQDVGLPPQVRLPSVSVENEA